MAERGAPATGGSADAHGFLNISQALEEVKGLGLKKTKRETMGPERISTVSSRGRTMRMSADH